MTTLCRDCSVLYARPPPNGRCEQCASPRLVSHEMLAELAIAHVDCDAFYATVEKRERPELADRPVIVGGGKRGVVLACCYVARLYGVRSAMPMFKALAACPDAEVIRPNMAKYREVGRAVRAEMRELTPLVEPVSIDEAFPRPVRHRGAARRRTGPIARYPRPAGRGRTRHHACRSGSATASFSPKSPRTWTSRAALPSSVETTRRLFSPTSRYRCCGA